MLEGHDPTISWPEGTETIVPQSDLYYWSTEFLDDTVDSLGEAAEFTLTTEEGDVTLPFMPDRLELPYAGWMIENRAGEDVVLTWPDVNPDARVYLRMEDCKGSHGGISKHEIECEQPDTGELTIPHAFLTKLEEGDWSRGNCGIHTFDRKIQQQVGDVTVSSLAAWSIYYFPNSGSHIQPQ